MDLPSRLDLYETGRRYLLARARNIDPSIVDVAGSDANLFVGSQSFMAHAVVRHLADRFAAHLIGSAQGEDLDRKLWDSYRLPRKGAAPAVTTVRFFRTNSTAGQGSIAAGRKIRSLTGVEYVTTTTASFAATQLEAYADVRATKAGKAYQVGRNQLRQIVDAASLFDPSLQVTNDEPAAGGEEREEDPDYRQRGKEFWPSARRGTLSAIAFGAKSIPGVASAEAVEVLDGGARPARVVQLYIADSSGVASRALGAQVDAQLEDYRAAGIAVITATSLPQIVPVRLHLAFAAGVETAPLVELIRANVVGFVNSTPTNGTLYRIGIGSQLTRFASQGLLPQESSIVEPAGDVVPAPGRTLRTTVDNVTIE